MTLLSAGDLVSAEMNAAVYARIVNIARDLFERRIVERHTWRRRVRHGEAGWYAGSQDDAGEDDATGEITPFHSSYEQQQHPTHTQE